VAPDVVSPPDPTPGASAADAAPGDEGPPDVPSEAPSADEIPAVELPKSNPNERGFTPQVLDRTVIAIPLLKILEEEEKKKKEDQKPIPVIIDLNLEHHHGRAGARAVVWKIVAEAIEKSGRGKEAQGINEAKSRLSQQYLFGRLHSEVIRELVRMDQAHAKKAAAGASHATHRSIYHIWPDFKVKGLLNKSLRTVKADAAQRSFSALGTDIVWAVIDSGIDGKHPHFQKHKNLILHLESSGTDPESEPSDTLTLVPRDFTALQSGQGRPLVDVFGHGTHVAGIIAGELIAAEQDVAIQATARHRDENGEITTERYAIPAITGMAPQCKLLSLKVLDDKGDGEASNLIAALEYIQELNGNGRRIRVHGVNMSVGYEFEPEWFACGQSPLCVEVDRLVRSGVVVVVAAGNSGYGGIAAQSGRVFAAGLDLTINDPGNAELAITVGATHRDMPHVYGVSYFSSKGPTGDGRPKPDLVAPGEKIISCRSADDQSSQFEPNDNYKEESGTSMAAPHVSGVIAAFLSVRREFLGQPEAVKKIFLSTATDLNRAPYFQGHGLVDLMRAIQSV
jgi:serine protease AprX